ncbi:hypothetical protein CPB85DRAFT_361379 [Mucidula mucida]|nr:hypothetical protein CPB85DRAFT_361379 [Mucidula mucida]
MMFCHLSPPILVSLFILRSSSCNKNARIAMQDHCLVKVPQQPHTPRTSTPRKCYLEQIQRASAWCRRDIDHYWNDRLVLDD